MRRRQVLATGVLAMVGLSGCQGGPLEAEPTTTELRRTQTATEQGPSRTTTERSTAQRTTVERETTTSTSSSGSQVQLAVTLDGETRTLVTGSDVKTVGDIEQTRPSGYVVPLTLTDRGTTAFTTTLEQIGAFDDPTACEITTSVGGERVATTALGEDLAAVMESGDWDGSLVVGVSDQATAERLRDAFLSE